MYKTVLMVLVTCILGTLGQLALKSGMNDIGRIGLASLYKIQTILMKVATSPKIWIGLFIYVLGTIVWLVILSRVDLSLAYPLLSMNFILVVLAAWLFLGESLTATRILGIIIICSGIVVLK